MKKQKKKSLSALDIYRSIRKPTPPPTKKHKTKKRYERKNDNSLLQDE